MYAGPDGQCLELWPQRAAYDPELKLLMVADAHFGKGHTFRRHGLPVPVASEAAMVQRLDALLQATGAQELVFLGDLLHGPWSQEPQALQALEQWRAQHPALEVHLVRGNHDHHAGDPALHLGIEVHAGPLRRGPWALIHEPQEIAGAYALAGHVHPGVQLHERGGLSLRLPCFRMTRVYGVLPAFGAFTGLHIQPAMGDDRVYAVVEEEGLVVPLQR
ncbi:MAG: ligase-associated DNA damage response endonuclease PdeM [Burkholderiales bacterium]|nr:ligase-associated DNA damage response endonuclease PdeM [Burkholderiales bacterium]NBO75787.1 ligase-associated DNA damage response endonuclease PdeM [Betaproteobacteria bacterium]